MVASIAFDDDLARRLPLPVAQLYRRAFNAKTPLERHLTAFYLWEAGLKLLASNAVVEYAQSGASDDELAERLQNLARPSLGHWWEFTRRLVPTLAERGSGFRNIRDLLLGERRNDLPLAAGLDAVLRESLGGKKAAQSTVCVTELFNRLVEYRNKVLAHAAPGQLNDSHHERMASALLAGEIEILRRLDVLAGRRLLYIAEVREAGGHWLIQRFEMMGENPRRIESLQMNRSETKRLPHAERLYVESVGPAGGEKTETLGGSLTSLHPLLIFEPEVGECLFLNARRGRQRAEYLCYTSGRTTTRADLGGEHRELLGRVLGCKVDETQVSAWEERTQSEEPRGDVLRAPTERTLGEFELISELGRGGMGLVYRAWQPSLGRQVALKKLLRTGDEKAEARFAREIRALGRVDHPNLVKVFTSGADGDQWYYAMELIEGAPLSTVCRRLEERSADAIDLATWQEAVSSVCEEERKKEKPLSDSSTRITRPSSASNLSGQEATRESIIRRGYVGQIVELARQVCDAAHALHEAGVVHRDIKPGNIMVTAEGNQAILMDLGLAQLADDIEGRLTRTRQFVGTLRYASPEQVMAVGALDRRTDVYSLGATLWELFTLRPLFAATENTPTPDLMQRIQFEEPQRMRRHHPGLALDLEAIVAKCLEKNPSRRYASARELGDELVRFQRGEPIRARPVGQMERLVRWCRRNPVVAGLAATGLFILVAGVIVSSIFAVEAGHRAESESKARIAAQKSEGEANRARKDVEDKKKELERREYVHRVALANYEWERNNIESAISLLENAPKEWRGWEWYCLRRRCNVVLRTIGSLPAPIIVAYSPDGKSLAALSLGNGQVKLWNPTTGAQIWQTTIPNLNGRSRVGQGFPLVFTPDGQRIAVGSIGGAIHILDATTGKEMTAWHGPGTTVLTLAVSPDGMWLASFSLQPEDPQDWGGGPGHILIWSMRAGTVVHDLKMPNHYIDLAFSPDSKNLAAAGVHNDTVGIWDVATGKLAERQLAGDSISASSVAYSPDGKLFAAARGDRIRIWDLATGRSITTLTGHAASVRQVLFTADSQRIVTASTDNSAKVWDLATSREVTTIRGNGRPLHSISLRPNSNELATSCDDWSIRTFDMDKSRGMFVSRPDGGLLSALSFHPGGRRIVDGNGFNLESWDPVSGRQLPTLGVGHMEAVFNTDGKQLAIAGSHYLESRPTVRLVDAESGKELKTLGRHKANVLHIAYSRDGSKIASNSEDRVLKIWNADSGEELRTIPNVLSAAMSPDGTQVATGNDKGVRLFEISSGNEIRSMPGQKYGVISLAFSPDGSRLVSGAHDRTGRVWDVATGQPIFQLDTHTNAVTCVAFSPDGRRLATASSDRTVKIWNAVNGDELLTLRGPSDVITKLEFSPDGNRVAVASGDSCLYIWDGTPIPEPKVK